MSLKLQSQTVNLVEYYDLDRFITQAYDLKKPCEVVPTEELSRGGYKLFDVEATPLDEHEQRQLETLKTEGYCEYGTGVVLQNLCHKGWIEPGKYLVSCS